MKTKTLSILLFILVFSSIVSAGVTSADQVEYSSNADFFDGQLFVISFNHNFDTDRINVFLDETQLQQKTSGDVKQSLEIFTESQTQYARYGISDSPRRTLWNLELVSNVIEEDPRDNAGTWAQNTCYDTDQDGASEWAQQAIQNDWDLDYEYKIYCSTTDGRYGNIGDIQSPDAVFEINWCVKASGKEKQCKTISNGQAGSGVIADLGQHAKVRFGGAFTTGNGAPIADDELAIHSNTIPNGWKVISEARYETWNSWVSNDLQDEYVDWAEGQISESTLQSDIDSKAINAYSTYTSSPFSDATVLDSNFEDGQLKIDTDTLGFPQSTVYVDAGPDGYVEVEKTAGIPEITSTDGDRFGEIGSGQISMTVKNVGQAEGSFAARIKSCDNSFSFDDTTETRKVDPGEKTTFTFSVSGSSTSSESGEISGSCTLHVEDTATGKDDTASVGLTLVQSNECTPHKLYTDVIDGREAVVKCKSSGTGFTVVEKCSSDETVQSQSGKLQCVKENEPSVEPACTLTLYDNPAGSDIEFTNPVCQLGKAVNGGISIIQSGVNLLRMVAASIVALITFSKVKPYADESFEEQKEARIIAPAAISILAGLAVYQLLGSWAVSLLVIIAAYLYKKFDSVTDALIGTIESGQKVHKKVEEVR